MAYFRPTTPRNCWSGFMEDQRAGLERVSARDKRSLVGIVRDAVDRHLQAVADGQGEKQKNGVPAPV